MLVSLAIVVFVDFVRWWFYCVVCIAFWLPVDSCLNALVWRVPCYRLFSIVLIIVCSLVLSCCFTCVLLLAFGAFLLCSLFIRACRENGFALNAKQHSLIVNGATCLNANHELILQLLGKSLIHTQFTCAASRLSDSVHCRKNDEFMELTLEE